MLKFVVALLVLNALIFIHELGHFLAAKHAGVHIEEFAIGFGPKLFSFKRGRTVYSLCVFPLGGYCKLKGEDNDRGNMESGEEDSFYAKPLKTRLAIIAMGPAMNFLVGVLVLVMLYFAVIGTPQLNSPIIGNVLPRSIAEEIGLQKGDMVLRIDTISIKQWPDIAPALRSGKAAKLIYERNGVEYSATLPKGTTALGIQPVFQKYRLGQSVTYGLQQSMIMVSDIFKTLPTVVQNKGNDVIGPVGLIKVMGDVFPTHDVFYYLIALISINLAIMNILPIPGLDGGRLMLLAVEFVRRRPINQRLEAWINICGLTLLLGLMVVLMFKDIMHFVL